MREVRIGSNEAGQRLDKFLKKYLREAGSGFLYKMLRKKNITRNGRRAEGSEILEEGDVVKFFLAEETLEKFRGPEAMETAGACHGGPKPPEIAGACHGGLEPSVLYEDANILLADKPAGMLTQKAAPGDYSLNEWLLDYLIGSGKVTKEELRAFRPSVCNRLDRNTSGLVICGKSLAGSRKMSELLKEHGLRKYYRALAAGEMAGDGIAESWLVKDQKTNRVWIGKSDPGRPDAARIRTGYRVLEASGGISYLEVELFTGKSHQIRAQMAALGHPLLGDGKYGDEGMNGRLRREGVQAQLLHAFRLEFPALSGTFEELSGRRFTAPEPEIFGRVKRIFGMQSS